MNLNGEILIVWQVKGMMMNVVVVGVAFSENPCFYRTHLAICCSLRNEEK
jgi:hypothetical protein